MAEEAQAKEENESSPLVVVNVSTDNLVDPLQIGWVEYREDNLIVSAKIVRSKSGRPFVSLPSLYSRAAGPVKILRYENEGAWAYKKKKILEVFKEYVGASRFFVPQ